MLAGDWHGFAPHADWVLRCAHASGIKRVFQVGDFGLWEHESAGIRYLDDLEEIASQDDITIYCLAGNHDNEKLTVQLHAANLDADGFVILRDHVKFALRGHRWTWEGTRFLALGGAYSVDKAWRVEKEIRMTAESHRGSIQYGKPLKSYTETLWFPDEELTHQNVITAIGDGSPVDVMLTHDKPLRSTPSWNRKDFPECVANQEKIQRVVDALEPTLLVHGHLHFPYDCAMRGQDGSFSTYVVGLDADNEAQRFERGYRRENSIAVLGLENGLKSITVNGDRTINL